MEKKERYQICAITGTRSEYGLLRGLLFKLRGNDEIDLRLVVTGSHLSSAFGKTENEIIEDGFADYTKVHIPTDDDSKEGMAFSAGVAMEKFARLFAGYKPEILIVLGDRFEILAAVFAAYLIGIPVAHISGGDITEGAVDDAIRHCLTKLSYFHFPGCEKSAKRIVQMGESPERVFNVGEPGVENCMNMKLMTRQDLAIDLGFEGINRSYSVVTFHPVTMEDGTAVNQVYELIKAMDCFSDMSYIITMANADAGGRAVNDIWTEERKKHSNWLVVASLGVLRYLSVVKHAKLVIGNSSSGLVEAPSLGTPTINIGNRQKGRMMAESVVCCMPDEEEIIAAMNEALADGFQEKAKYTCSPFGDGSTSEQIAKIVLDYVKSEKNADEKQFYDIDFSMGGYFDGEYRNCSR